MPYYTREQFDAIRARDVEVAARFASYEVYVANLERMTREMKRVPLRPIALLAFHTLATK